MTTTIDLAQTLAVDGINATRVSHPGKTDFQGKALRGYDLFFAIAGAEQRDDHSDRTDENGKTVYNAIRVTVEHDGYRKAFRATVKACFLHRHGYSDVFGFGASAAPEGTLAEPVPAGRYGRKGLDALADQVFARLTGDGFPRDNEALADLWDKIVVSHGVPAPALAPAGA